MRPRLTPRRFLRAYCSTFIAAWLIGGCGAAVVEQENLRVGLSVEDRVSNASATELSLAVGATSSVAVFEHQSLESGSQWVMPEQINRGRVESAVSADPQILEVVGTTTDSVNVSALAAGRTTLTVTTHLGVRTFQINVGEPMRVTLRHAVWNPSDEGPAPLALLGGTSRFSLLRLDTARRELSGATIAVAVHPDPPPNAVVEMVSGSPNQLNVRFERPGILALRPMGGAALDLEVVEASAVTSVNVVGFTPGGARSEPLESLQTGQERIVRTVLRTIDGREVIGQLGRTRLESTEPAACAVASADQFWGDGFFTVTGVSAGECTLHVVFEEHEVQTSFPITP